MTNKYDIFISYRREDGVQYARILQLELQKRGYHVFLDYGELTEGIFGENIRKAIEKAPIFIAILSPHYLDRCSNEHDRVRSELLLAIKFNKHFIPINPDNQFAGIPAGIPDEIAELVEGHQQSGISFGQYMNACIDSMIKNRIAGRLNPTSIRSLWTRITDIINNRVSRDGSLNHDNNHCFHSSSDIIVNKKWNESNDSDEQCQEYKYDVFLSSKSEDYPLTEDVYEYLRKNGLKAFAASKELDKIGEAEYADAIDSALDATTHMIVIASSAENIESKWVKYEWSTFKNDLKSGYREGNLLTILDGISPRDLPAGLRHQQSFNYDSFKDGRILGYLKHKEKVAGEHGGR